MNECNVVLYCFYLLYLLVVTRDQCMQECWCCNVTVQKLHHFGGMFANSYYWHRLYIYSLINIIQIEYKAVFLRDTAKQWHPSPDYLQNFIDLCLKIYTSNYLRHSLLALSRATHASACILPKEKWKDDFDRWWSSDVWHVQSLISFVIVAGRFFHF